MTKEEHDKIIHLMDHGALQSIDTGRLDGKCEAVIPLEDAVDIINLVYKVKSKDKEEMTIEKCRNHLLVIMDSMPDDACGDWRDALAYAIEIIDKYKKLQSDYKNCLKADLESLNEMKKKRKKMIHGIYKLINRH